MVDSDSRTSRFLVDQTDEPAALLGGFAPCGCRSEPSFRWYVIATEYNAEKDVEKTIRARGMSAWRPRFMGKKGLLLLFPRYIFVQADLADNRWQALYTDRGVDTLLGTRGERPTPVPVGVLEHLWRDCTDQGVMKDESPPPARAVKTKPIAAGAVVRVEAGRFAGWEGICRKSSATRVELLLSVMGREVPVKMPRQDVDPV